MKIIRAKDYNDICVPILPTFAICLRHGVRR